MKFHTLTLLTISLLGIVPSAAIANYECQLASLNDAKQPLFKPLKKVLVPDDSIVVVSDESDIKHGDQIQFNGNVIIHQQQQTVTADKATFKEKESQFIANGNVELQSATASVRGESIFIDEKNKDFELLNAKYKLGFNSGRGTAESFSIESSSALALNGATFTTCPGDDPSWLFSSSEINISQQDGWGEAWNTVFKIGDVPVLYLPYITFPITDVRKSGLLFPKFGSNTRLGTYYSQPIYFNLATNYDMTFTPTFMSERGWLWKTNGRYLSEKSSNILQLEYMASDDDFPELESRFLSYFQHESDLSDNWRFQVQWTELSDDSYISDFNSDFHHQADTHLNNLAQLSYQTDTLLLRILTQNIAELGAHSQSYKIPAQVEIDWSASSRPDGFGFDVYSSITQFSNDSVNENKVSRAHIEPELKYSYYQPAFQLEASASYLATKYKQQFQDTDVDQTVNRGVAKFRLLTGLNFEKFGRYFGKNVRQTLEPKLQYLYIEESDQSQIGLYDTQRLKEDYFALFRSQTYSSIDRIEALNQVTVGVSSSIFDESNQEIFRFGLGQVHKLGNKLINTGTNDDTEDSKPALAIEVFGQLSENWQIDGGLLYDRESKRASSGFVALDYWIDEDKNVQINHRYVRDVADTTINQTGLFGSYKLNEQWSVAASYHYDTERNINLDSVVGFEYRSCCWSIQVSAQRQVVLDLTNTDFDNGALTQYENGIGINFKFQGLGGETVSDISKLFSDSIFAYRRPYLITK